MHFNILNISISLLLAVSIQAASVINVPKDFINISAAIKAAKAGDTVRLSPGVYNEKNILVTEGITIVSQDGNPTNTIIDPMKSGRGFIIENKSVTPVTISGVTIQNAKIPFREAGGAVLVTTGKAVIHRSIIQGTTGSDFYGGGPVNNATTNVDNVIVGNCIIRKNVGANGCGVNNCAVVGCLIYDNWALNNPMALSNCNATNCTVYNNTGGFLENAWTAGGMSGGVAVNCIFWGNSGHNGQQVNRTGNQIITYSIVQRGFVGQGNLDLDSDPSFIDISAGNFRLKKGSPAFQSGNPSILNLDGSRSDMGAYGGNFTFRIAN